jgi:phage shock protein C
MKKKFRVDRSEGKLFGVCAGIADYMDWDPTWVRVGVVALTVCGAFPWTLIVYGLTAWLAPKVTPSAAAERRSVGAEDLRMRMRDFDRRMAEVETYVTSPSTRRRSSR